MDDKKIAEMVVKLFESKCKHYTDITIDVWVQELKEMPSKYIPNAIKDCILSPDDFPTIGKVKQLVDKSRAFDEDMTEILDYKPRAELTHG